MRVNINGEVSDIPPDSTISDLLESMSVNPEHVAVEVNKVIIPRSVHRKHHIAPDDVVEIVRFVGGG